MHCSRNSLFVAGMLLSLLLTVTASNSFGSPATARTLDRNEDPVIIEGKNMPDFIDAPLHQLFVYAFRDNQWRQIPWQFDEKQDSMYTAEGNKKLDLADELVIMGRDCGDRAASGDWISDTTSRTYPRYQITVVDPLNTSKLGWVYVYRSLTLTDTVKTDYVDLDYHSSVFTTPVYKLGFMLKYLGGDRLELNGSGIDVLDRSKFRFQPAGQEVFGEEFAEFDEPQPEIIDGRVRAIAGYQIKGQGILTYAYRSQFYDLVAVDLSWIPIPIDWARASADFNENIVPGVYYDANTPLGVPVDGVPDAVATTPAIQWQQISSSTGTIIHTADIAPMQGVATTWYRDDATTDPADTGDKKSYGDMGLTVTNPIKYLYLAVTHYILPPNHPNVGATYHDYFTHPLQFYANWTSVENAGAGETPLSFSLSANYPNPFNPVTTMHYQVGQTSGVELAIYDASGRKTRSLVNENKTPGDYVVQWNGLEDSGQPAASGIYFCTMKAGAFKMTRRLLLLK